MSRPGADVLRDTTTALREILGERLSTCESILSEHGHDESWHRTVPPDIVVFPESTDEIAAIVRACAQRGVPIIPYGAGTSVEGQLQAVEGGVCLDLSGMCEVLRVSVDDMDCTVQPGVHREQLNHYLRHTGLFFPVDPGADASIGGMAATRASGTNALRYGTMRENVLGLQVVLANGEVIRTGGRSRKSAAGYDLTRLLVGSEGTLGVITEVTLRLHGLPESVCSASVRFPEVGDAVRTSIAAVQHCIPLARMELLDGAALRAINAYKKTAFPQVPTLFLEFHGTVSEVGEQARRFGELAEQHHGSDFDWAVEEEERNRLWQARHHAYWAAIAARPGGRGLTTDVCVPVSDLADCIDATIADIDRSFLDAPIVGHIGDGNFHVIFSIDPDDEREVAEARGLNERLIDRALEVGGTCTGEHGIGTGKREFLCREHGASVDVMVAIKRALDPDNLMNPGKVVPDAPG